jgi:hypothetical protein
MDVAGMSDRTKTRVVSYLPATMTDTVASCLSFASHSFASHSSIAAQIIGHHRHNTLTALDSAATPDSLASLFTVDGSPTLPKCGGHSPFLRKQKVFGRLSGRRHRSLFVAPIATADF